MAGRKWSVFKPASLGKKFERADQKRQSSAKRGYGRKWRAIRAKFLDAHPFCTACGAIATEVDHIIAKSKGGTDQWSNLQPFCKSCHARKTVKIDGALKAKNRSSLGGVDPCPNPFRVSTEFMFGCEEADDGEE